MSTSPTDVERSVRERYSEAADARTEALCCPVDYDAQYLKMIPQEIIDRDYGCGDPSKHLNAGETVLDLGSGGGKICYIASQVVGPEGRVIGVDMNDEMLQLAESHRSAIGDRIGHHNVEFKKGRIQDLALDYRKLEERLAAHPVTTPEELSALDEWKNESRKNNPLIADDAVDVIVSNCVLNLVHPEDKHELFHEMFRVLRAGGRAVISDIVADQEIPQELVDDPELWSGCVSGAYVEDEFLAAFEDVGFSGIRILTRDAKPWRVVGGIEFRSLTVEAFKFDEQPELDRHHAMIYKGPWSCVTDDNGQTLFRGERMAVSDQTYRVLTQAPYADQVYAIAPVSPIPASEAAPFECDPGALRSPLETRGETTDDDSTSPGGCCGGES